MPPYYRSLLWRDTLSQGDRVIGRGEWYRRDHDGEGSIPRDWTSGWLKYQTDVTIGSVYQEIIIRLHGSPSQRGTIHWYTDPIVTSVWYFSILTFLEYGCFILSQYTPHSIVRHTLLRPTSLVVIALEVVLVWSSMKQPLLQPLLIQLKHTYVQMFTRLLFCFYVVILSV